MLSHLTIENFALIDRLSLEFCGQLNVLTGETGAGKSIMIDALRFVLGDRFNSTQIRDAKLPCSVEAVFELNRKDIRHQPIFSEYLPSDETQIIIQRATFPDGKNKIKVNGASVTVSQLKEIGNHLIDFHGANDHQLLLSDESHLGILDQLTSLGALKTDYEKIYAEYARLQKELTDLQEAGKSRERDLDLLQHQVTELSQVPLDPSKYEELLAEETRLNNAEKLYGCVNAILTQIEDEENGISEKIRQAFSPMRTLTQIDPKMSTNMELLNQIQENIQQLKVDLNDYGNSLSFEPEAAKEIRNRYDSYESIKRKYGPSLEDAQKFFTEASKRYELLKNLEHNDQQLREQISGKEKELKKIAAKITQERQKASTALQKTIEKELSELGIVHVQFESRIEKTELNRHGHDKVTFYISPNAGEALKPLSQIVSSGEAARLMLALKKALIKVDPIPVLIFDEIDAQIGGRLGTITGTKLKEISKIRQVILITHLAQIAAFGDHHFKVTKGIKNGRALTQVNCLEPQARVKELAQMMSGEKETSISLTHAQELLTKVGNK
ncbi:MAG TPA: DNA repair protein RecN [Candidatus Omnitrophota bacterium]|nr:DNA repair protein RecN [Candidatus Omnitrophota bacterium]